MEAFLLGATETDVVVPGDWIAVDAIRHAQVIRIVAERPAAEH